MPDSNPVTEATEALAAGIAYHLKIAGHGQDREAAYDLKAALDNFAGVLLQEAREAQTPTTAGPTGAGQILQAARNFLLLRRNQDGTVNLTATEARDLLDTLAALE